MDDAPLDARYAAALRCYEQCRSAQPGSELSETAEHAILLALSPQRPDKPVAFIHRDALRDAAHSLRRGAARQEQAFAGAAHLAAQGIRVASTAPFADDVSTEQRVLDREDLRELGDRARLMGEPAPRVLGGLLIGESENATAAAVGASRATVTRIRRALRDACGINGLLAA